MGKYQKEIIPNKTQPNLNEVGSRIKKVQKCYFCNEKIKGNFITDSSRKKFRLYCFKCGSGEL
jgi:hypothetical protein